MSNWILCATDLSDVSNNAVEYAANLAYQTDKSLWLFHAHYVPFMDHGPDEDQSKAQRVVKNEVEVKKLIKEQALEVQNRFGIECHGESIHDHQPDFEKSIKEACQRVHPYLVVMGTHGVKDLSSLIMGTHTYHVMKEAKVPVLAIPYEVNYKKIQHIVYAWDKGNKKVSDIKILDDLRRSLDAFLTVLHVTKEEGDIGVEAFNSFSEQMKGAVSKDKGLELKRMVEKDIPNAIDSYMHEANADLLALTIHKDNLYNDLFHKSLTKKLTSFSDYPIIAFHPE